MVEDGVDIWLVVDRGGIWLEVEYEVSIGDITTKRPRPKSTDKVSTCADRFQLRSLAVFRLFRLLLLFHAITSLLQLLLSL
jgi:hypothetical protein